MKKLVSSLIVCAAIVSCLTACGKDASISVDNPEITTNASDAAVENGVGDIITPAEDDEDASISVDNSEITTAASDAAVENGVGDIITPAEDDEDADLGSYRESSSGIKLYYNDEDVPTELMLALEKYFTSYSKHDYETYLTCLYPGYKENMEAYLQRDYQYGLDTSFETQCANLENNMGGSYKITRIRAVPVGTIDEFTPEEYLDETVDTEAEIKDFFSTYDSIFEKDYYSEVMSAVDKTEYLTFSVISI